MPADTNPQPDSGRMDRRRRRGGGYLITDDQLEQEQDYPLASVLVAHFPGLRVVRGTLSDRVASAIHVSIVYDPCYVQIYVDGVFLEDGSVDMIQVRDLDSIEYHTPGNIPVQFQNRLPGSACGVLLFWSKV
ncbi:MAG TPA: hypothetical protein VII66_07360 [Gemmatimonadaceae bacterium]